MKINEHGFLMLKRAGKHRLIECPKSVSSYDITYDGDKKYSKIVCRSLCGDWCFLFREPIIDRDGVCIRICEGLHFYCDKEDFIDERG